MARVLRIKLSTDKLWFGLLVLYIVSGYLAQDVLLPASLNQLAMYAFLGFSMAVILLRGKVKLNNIVLWELLCLGLAFAAMLYGPEFSILGGTYYVLIVNFILVFIFAQMPWNEKQFAMVMKTYVFSAVVLIAVLAATGNLEDQSESGRLGQELTGNANILAMMLMVSAMYGIWLLVSSKGTGFKLLVLAAVVLIYIGMFLSGGRKYIVVPIVFAYILLLNSRDKKGRKHIIRNTLLIIAVVILVYQVIMKVPFFYESIGNRFEGFFGLFDDGHKMDNSTLLRKEMIEAAFERWLDSPLWGFGFDSFKHYNAAEVTGHMYYSHNNFAELLYNQGLIGFVGYYGFYVWLLRSAMKKAISSQNRGFILGAVFSILAFEYFGITYSATPAQFLLFFCYYRLKSDAVVDSKGAGKKTVA